uniref:Fibronectin type-III domain-containing protein n=1 Tax=Knipowitschia caucasica TaxID=637954 RepID=A0AAV2LJI4_KNICA
MRAVLMKMTSEKTCVLLTPRPASCIFQTAEEKDELLGDESVLEMLSSSKFWDLESWLCMPSSLRLRSSSSSSSSSSQTSLRCSDRLQSFLSSTLVRDSQFVSSPVLTITPPTSTSSPLQTTSSPSHTAFPSSEVPPTPSSPPDVSLRKRRRLGASPGGLHWTSAGLVQRDFLSPTSPDLSPDLSPDPSPTATGVWGGGALRDRCDAARVTVTVGDAFLQRTTKLRGARRLRTQTGGSAGPFTLRKQPAGGSAGRPCQWKRWSLGDGLHTEVTSLFSSDLHRRAAAVMQQMQSLQLTPRGRTPGPTSPNAAKRLYRNLSDKLRGSSASFEDTHFFGKTERLRKASTMQISEVLLEAVEQQDLDTVQILLFQFSPEELDLNAPNSQGLTPLDISIMTNNQPISKLLLKAGARESPQFSSVECRDQLLSSLVQESEQRAADLSAQAQREGLSLEEREKNQTLRSWEWRSRLYARMRAGFQGTRPPEAPSMMRLTVSSSSTLTVSFQEPQGLNCAVVTKYKVQWSCLQDFSLVAGETVLENLQSLRFCITGLTTGQVYFVRVSAFNMKGWGPPATAQPPGAAPSNWRDCDGREQKRRSQTDAMEKLLLQVQSTHSEYCSGDVKLQNSRKQSVSRSLKHLFSNNKFIKTLKRGVYLATVLFHRDCLLLTAEDHVPIVEVDDSFGSSLLQDFLWFTKMSCMWEDVRWLRQSMSVSMSSSSTLQTRHKMLTAAAHMQSLLGTHNLGRAHYEPIKDRHGNVLLVTVREAESQSSALNGKWTSVTKLQSQRKSLSTPEEPYALDILIITMQDLLSYHRRSCYRLSSGLYLGYLKLSSSVDQIRVLVSQRTPNMLPHVRVRDNSNVSREEWEWIQRLAASSSSAAVIGGEAQEAGLATQRNTPMLYYELQTAIKALLKILNLQPSQVCAEMSRAKQGLCRGEPMDL